jgi:hypothetical protein
LPLPLGQIQKLPEELEVCCVLATALRVRDRLTILDENGGIQGKFIFLRVKGLR